MAGRSSNTIREKRFGKVAQKRACKIGRASGIFAPVRTNAKLYGLILCGALLIGNGSGSYAQVLRDPPGGLPSERRAKHQRDAEIIEYCARFSTMAAIQPPSRFGTAQQWRQTLIREGYRPEFVDQTVKEVFRKQREWDLYWKLRSECLIEFGGPSSPSSLPKGTAPTAK
jgi:hypothetical protein